MKKLLTLLLSVALSSAFVFAQTTTDQKFLSKKGYSILPEAGDWAIGVDATPFLNFAGNVLNITTKNDAPTFGFTAQNPGMIIGKYVDSETKYYRAGLIIGVPKDVEEIPAANTDDKPNKLKSSAFALGLKLGIENRRPLKNRLAGFYGYEAGILYSPYTGRNYNNSDTITGKFTYEDVTTNDNGFSETGANTFTFTASGFVGVEYFFAPKMSITGEIGLSLNAYMTGERYYEPIGEDKVLISSKKSGINIAPKTSGALALNLYF